MTSNGEASEHLRKDIKELKKNQTENKEELLSKLKVFLIHEKNKSVLSMSWNKLFFHINSLLRLAEEKDLEITLEEEFSKSLPSLRKMFPDLVTVDEVLGKVIIDEHPMFGDNTSKLNDETFTQILNSPLF